MRTVNTYDFSCIAHQPAHKTHYLSRRRSGLIFREQGLRARGPDGPRHPRQALKTCGETGPFCTLQAFRTLRSQEHTRRRDRTAQQCTNKAHHIRRTP